MQSQLTAEDIADLRLPENVRTSKDGSFIVYTVRSLTRNDPEPPKSSIWIAETNKENSAKELVPADSKNDLPPFSPDGRFIAYISDQANALCNRDLYILELADPSNVTKLTSAAENGCISAFRWRPQGQQIIFNAQPMDEAPTDIKVYGENLRYSNLWAVTVNSREISRLMTEEADVVFFELNADGSKVYYCTRDESDFGSSDFGQEIRMLDLSTLESLSMYRTNYRVQGFSVLNDTVFIIAPLDEDMGVHWHSPSIHSVHQGVALVQEGMTDSIRAIDGSVIFEAQQTFTGFDLAFVGEMSVLALIKDSTGVLSEVYSVASGQICQLSSHSKGVAKKAAATIKITEENHEDIHMSAFWSIPPRLQSDFGRKPQPTVVLIKGGPSGRVTDCFGASLLHFAPYLLSQGYLVLQPNYRGSNGHGDAYARCINANAAISYDDMIWHVKKGIADCIIDPNRVAVAGWSQGGYLTYLAAGRDSTFHFTAAVAGAGIADQYLESVVTDIPILESSLMGFKPWDEDVLESHRLPRDSPIHYVKNVKTPLLILHGEEDVRIPVSHSRLFALAMKEHKKPFEMAIYPKENHGFPFMWDRAHYIDLLERLSRFLGKHMR